MSVNEDKQNKPKDPHENLKDSIKIIEDLRNGRQQSDIPLSETTYWNEVNKHRLFHNK